MPARKKINTVHTLYWVSYGPDAYHWMHTAKRAESLAEAKRHLAAKPAWAKAWAVLRSRDTMFARVDMKVVGASDAWTKEMAQRLIESQRGQWKKNPHPAIEAYNRARDAEIEAKKRTPAGKMAAARANAKTRMRLRGRAAVDRGEWRLTACPYAPGTWRAEAWKEGAWARQQELRGTRKNNPPMSKAEALAIRRILKRHGY